MLQLVRVLDRAVVHDGDAVLLVRVRVRVLVRLAAVRGPARVRNADAVGQVARRRGRLQHGDGVGGGALRRHLRHDDLGGGRCGGGGAGAGRCGADGGDAGAVVAAVLQDGEALEQEVERGLLADEGDDAAALRGLRLLRLLLIAAGDVGGDGSEGSGSGDES